MTHPEEDWSIISSSSDLDDESSTSSRETERDQRPELDFKAPEIHLDSPPVDSSEAKDDSTNLDETISIERPGPEVSGPARPSGPSGPAGTTSTTRGSFGSGSETDSTLNPHSRNASYSETATTPTESTGATSTTTAAAAPQTSESAPTKTRPLDSKISFYESLSHINESIKQKSSDFYSNFAKTKLDRLNDYISPPEQALGESEVLVSPEDTEEATTPESSGSPGPVIDPGSGFVGILPAKEKRYKNEVARTIAKLQAFLDNHSDYLYYYCSGIIISILVASYSYNYVNTALFPKPEPKPPTLLVQPLDLWETIVKGWDNYIYQEEESVSYFFFSKKKRTNRIINLTTQFATNSIAGGQELIDKFVITPYNDINRYSPIVWNWINEQTFTGWDLFQTKSTVFLENSNELFNLWLNKSQNFGVFAYSRAQELADLGSHLAYKHSVEGWNYLQDSSRLGWSYSAPFRKQVIEVFPTVEETRDFFGVLSRNGKEASKIALCNIQMGSVQIHQAWRELLASWQELTFCN